MNFNRTCKKDPKLYANLYLAIIYVEKNLEFWLQFRTPWNHSKVLQIEQHSMMYAMHTVHTLYNVCIHFIYYTIYMNIEKCLLLKWNSHKIRHKSYTIVNTHQKHIYSFSLIAFIAVTLSLWLLFLYDISHIILEKKNNQHKYWVRVESRIRDDRWWQ